jgi:hypothetical protein
MTNHPLDQFRVIQDTRAIQKIPNQWGHVRDKLKLFKRQGVASTTVGLMEVNGVLSLAAAKPRGSEPSETAKPGRVKRWFDIPHFPLHDRVLPESVQDVVDFETGQKLDTMDMAIARQMKIHRDSLAITEEWLQVGALRGDILNNDGNVIYNFRSYALTKLHTAKSMG